MLAFISKTADKRIIDSLKQATGEVVSLEPFGALAEPVSSHADMLLCAVGDRLFIHKDYVCNICGFSEVIRVDESISNEYPSDVLLNIAIVGKHAFCNTKFASKTVLEYLKKSGFDIHNVSQGYSHCSICIVSENAIITADKGICNAANEAGIDVLLIREGHVSLAPYDYGFIGGACGNTDDAVYFCGSLDYHPDGEKIRSFCKSYGKEVRELIDAPLLDVGGILFV